MAAETPIEIPETMKRLVVREACPDLASCKIEVEEVPVPRPGNGQVLIKVAAAPINPSDYGSWTRAKKTPLPMGNEGCGIVVEVGSGLTTGYACPQGTPVGFVGLKNDQGTYSEYVVAAAIGEVFTLPKDLPIEDGCSFFINPYTAVAIIDTAKQQGAKAFVHTAAASQLGQMMVKLAPSEGVEIINVVRREEQKQVLKELGAEHIIVTTGDEAAWKAELKAKVTELGATCAFDAVAGKSTGDLIEVLPPKGVVYVYGGLAGKVSGIDPMDLIYRKKEVRGFLLTTWVKASGSISMLSRMVSASRKVNSGLNGGWSSSQFTDTTLENAQADIVKLLDTKATGQKLRIRFETESRTD